MLTVIVSVRRSAIQFLLHQLANHMQHRCMNLLHARGPLFLAPRYGASAILPGFAAAAGQRDRDQPALVRRFQPAQHVRRIAARADADRDVAVRARAPRSAARTRDRSRSRCPPPSARSCRSSTRSPATPCDRARSARPAPRRSAARPPRCRRCRTSNTAPPCFSAAAIALAAATTASALGGHALVRGRGSFNTRTTCAAPLRIVSRASLLRLRRAAADSDRAPCSP